MRGGMETHDDKDHGPDLEGLADLLNIEGRAKRMTMEGRNLITAGQPEETAIHEYVFQDAVVRKLPDDPACTRVSIGMLQVLTPGAIYCVFRGGRQEAIRAVEKALAALKAGAGR